MPAPRGGEESLSDQVLREFLEAIKRVSVGTSDITLMEAVIASRSHHEFNPHTVWHNIVADSKRVIEGEYLLLRQGLGREGRNRLDVTVVDGVLALNGDRIADALGLAVGTATDSGAMKWNTVSLSRITDRVWAIDPSMLEGELVTFATFNETQITSAWQGSINPSDYEFASAS